jgi:hypothetical protein
MTCDAKITIPQSKMMASKMLALFSIVFVMRFSSFIIFFSFNLKQFPKLSWTFNLPLIDACPTQGE